MNSHVGFQFRRCVAGVATLFAIVTFLCIIKKLVHFELAGHLEITLLVVCCMYQCFRKSDESSFTLRELFVKVKVAKLISTQMILA